MEKQFKQAKLDAFSSKKFEDSLVKISINCMKFKKRSIWPDISCLAIVSVLARKTFVSPMMGCWRFSDPRILGAVAATQQTFLLSPAPIQANTRGGDND